MQVSHCEELIITNNNDDHNNKQLTRQEFNKGQTVNYYEKASREF